jgi:hypothetical protein
VGTSYDRSTRRWKVANPRATCYYNALVLAEDGVGRWWERFPRAVLFVVRKGSVCRRATVQTLMGTVF